MDFSFENKLAPKAGRLLLSDPFESDLYFERSVVFLCQHDEESSFGFVINKPIRIGIEGVNEAFGQQPIDAFKGGPCEEESLFFLHTLGDKIQGSEQIIDGIYLGTNFSDLYKTMTPESIENGAIKLFVGYSGWSSGQLDDELKRNVWVVAEVDDINEIMLSGKDSWYEIMKRLGNKYEMMTKFPLNPNHN